MYIEKRYVSGYDNFEKVSAYYVVRQVGKATWWLLGR